MITIDEVPVSSDERLRVTFTMPAVDGCKCLYLVGWYDEWNESVYRMERTSEGGWSFTLELESHCSYHYCFRTDCGDLLYDPDVPRMLDPLGAQGRNSFIIGHRGLG